MPAVMVFALSCDFELLLLSFRYRVYLKGQHSTGNCLLRNMSFIIIGKVCPDIQRVLTLYCYIKSKLSVIFSRKKLCLRYPSQRLCKKSYVVDVLEITAICGLYCSLWVPDGRFMGCSFVIVRYSDLYGISVGVYRVSRTYNEVSFHFIV